MPQLNEWPLDTAMMSRTAKRLARELKEKPNLRDIRVAVLGGSTTNELVTFLELMLLERGFRPVFWQSEFGRYWEDAVLGNAELAEFHPDLVYVHTTVRNVQAFVPTGASLEDALQAEAAECERFLQIWESIQKMHPCTVIQNNFELPDARIFGNYDLTLQSGNVAQIHRLNRALAEQARTRSWLILHDLNYLASQVGLHAWHDPSRWFSYKLAITQQATGALAQSLGSLIGARYGQSKKVLVLDLDNTLWGGIIGDDGVDNIVIGRETPQAEAYTAFQEYCLSLKARGIVLAVCSKNSDAIAREGFNHPDSVLNILDFASFKANWSPKHENIIEIAHELNLGLESFVFVDDNPAERALVRAQLPMVAVPEVGADSSLYAQIIDRQRYFETLSISSEDLQRSSQYVANAKRNESQAKFQNYDEYLISLEMRAEAGSFVPAYMERIAQLTNKSNQFNLTTKRYSLAEVTSIAEDPLFATLYIRLKDRFGDNGLISVLVGRQQGDVLEIDLWLMSCRVLKRDVELLALDLLADEARKRGIRFLRGFYFRTPKNDMVSRHYERLGFTAVEETPDRSTWLFELSNYTERNRNIHLDDQRRDTRTPEPVVS